MKKLSLILCLCVLCGIFGCSLWVRHAYDDQPIGESVRTTVITVGNSIRLRNLDFQNLSTTPGGNVTTRVDTLQPSVQFGTYSGQMQWDTATSKMQFSNDDGTTWSDLGSGGGTTEHCLVFPTITELPLSVSQGSSIFTWNTPLNIQLSVMANINEVGTGGGVLWGLVDTTTGCDRLVFKLTEERKLFFRQSTSSAPCVYVNYSSQAIPNYSSTEVPNFWWGRWAEYAIQVIDGTSVTFYFNGTALRSVPSVSTTDVYTAGERLDIFDNFAGRGGIVKMGRSLFWPATGWKGISHEKRPFFDFLYLPLTEGTGNPVDSVAAITFTKDADVTWEVVPGGF